MVVAVVLLPQLLQLALQLVVALGQSSVRALLPLPLLCQRPLVFSRLYQLLPQLLDPQLELSNHALVVGLYLLHPLGKVILLEEKVGF